jgi:translocation and assembly module TamB
MVELQVPDISPLIAFLPQFESLNGSISGSAALSGSLSEPVIDGGVELLHGNIVMSDLGLDLSDIYFLAETTDGLLYSIDGEMQSCAGGLTIDGSLNLGDDEAVSILNVNGDNFEFCNSATFQLTVSPDIQIRTQGRNIMITGDVSVPQADIRPAGGTGSGAISASPDQVIIDSSADEQALPLLINSEVNVHLGDQVRFTGFGLKTRLTGNLEITDPPRKPTLARGELQLVDGTFEAYGQSLDIEEGRIIYAGGPLYQPGIVFRAVRRPNRNVEVGFNVTGSVTSPQLEMFSFPAMSQAEQLSWLTTGRPLSALSSGESSSLTQTALALSLAGDSAIADRIGNRLGLDQFGIAASGAGFEGEQGGQSSLTIGKYLSPRLFISYAIGVFEPVNIFRAEFSLNNHWKLVTETDGVNNRGDIFYEIEKGSVSGNLPVEDENSELE